MDAQSQSKRIHSVVVTVAKVHGSQVLEDLLHGEEKYLGAAPCYVFLLFRSSNLEYPKVLQD